MPTLPADADFEGKPTMLLIKRALKSKDKVSMPPTTDQTFEI